MEITPNQSHLSLMELIPIVEKIKFLKSSLNLNGKQIAFLIRVKNIDNIKDIDESPEKLRLFQLYSIVKKILEIKPEFTSKEISYFLKKGLIQIQKENYEIDIPLIGYIRAYPKNTDLSNNIEKILVDFQIPLNLNN
jgi:hypothetical protein